MAFFNHKEFLDAKHQVYTIRIWLDSSNCLIHWLTNSPIHKV